MKATACPFISQADLRFFPLRDTPLMRALHSRLPRAVGREGVGAARRAFAAPFALWIDHRRPAAYPGRLGTRNSLALSEVGEGTGRRVKLVGISFERHSPSFGARFFFLLRPAPRPIAAPPTELRHQVHPEPGQSDRILFAGCARRAGDGAGAARRGGGNLARSRARARQRRTNCRIPFH